MISYRFFYHALSSCGVLFITKIFTTEISTYQFLMVITYTIANYNRLCVYCRQEELWCGHAQQRSGQVSVWNMTTQHCRVLAHAQEKDNRTVHAITSDNDAVWSYVYPGNAPIPLTRACLLSDVIEFFACVHRNGSVPMECTDSPGDPLS